MVISKNPTVITSAPLASTARDLVSINMLPQDPLISKAELVQFDKVQFGSQLSGPRLHTQDSVPVAQADENGNYLYEIGTPQFDQVNTHGIVAGALATYEHYTGHTIPWSFKGPLEVNPHAGEGKTAYYSRWDQSINFSSGTPPRWAKPSRPPRPSMSAPTRWVTRFWMACAPDCSAAPRARLSTKGLATARPSSTPCSTIPICNRFWSTTAAISPSPV